MEFATKHGVPVFGLPESMPEIMAIDGIEDWEMRLKRQDAFWNRAVIDRPVVHMTVPTPNPVPLPEKEFPSCKERWLDTEYVVESAVAKVSNVSYMGDALPLVFPNLGPEVFSAYFGLDMEYSETTSWAVPNLEDWSDVDKLRFSPDNFYWRKTLELTDALLEAGTGRFYVGYTDLHPGGDALAAFRDPLNLNFDLVDAPEKVKELLKYVDEVFIDVLNFWCDKLRGAGQAIGTWAGIVSRGKSHVHPTISPA